MVFLFWGGFRFLRMRDFDLEKSKEMFVNYLKWREEYRVDAIPKVIFLDLCLFLPQNGCYISPNDVGCRMITAGIQVSGV